MGKQKMLFFDIDGTLVTQDERHFLPPSTKAALQKARENGHKIFINTGRVMANIDEFVKSLAIDGYVCGCGTSIYYNNEMLLHNQLEKKLCTSVANMCKENKIFGFFESDIGIVVDENVSINKGGERFIKFFNALGMKVTQADTKNIIFDKFAMWFDEKNDITIFRKEIEKNFDYIDRGPTMAEIVPTGFSKATGIKYLMEYMGIPLEDCYAFGDSSNDLSMLEYVPHSIAMGNSMPEVFDVVEYVTKDICDDGIENALRNYGII